MRRFELFKRRSLEERIRRRLVVVANVNRAFSVARLFLLLLFMIPQASSAELKKITFGYSTVGAMATDLYKKQ